MERQASLQSYDNGLSCSKVLLMLTEAGMHFEKQFQDSQKEDLMHFVSMP